MRKTFYLTIGKQRNWLIKGEVLQFLSGKKAVFIKQIKPVWWRKILSKIGFDMHIGELKCMHLA